VFLALAAALPSRAVPPVVAVFALLQGLCTVLFYTWRGLY
jgi:hydrogenase/urease accessory protein HupE